MEEEGRTERREREGGKANGGSPTPLIRRGCSLPRLGVDTHPLPFPPTVVTFWSPKPDYSTLRLRLGGKVPFPWKLHYFFSIENWVRSTCSPWWHQTLFLTTNAALFRSRLRSTPDSLHSSLPCSMSAAINLDQDKMSPSAMQVRIPPLSICRNSQL